MLNRHPAISICDETYYFYYVYARRRAFGDLNHPDARRHLVARYLATQRIQRLGLDLKRLSDVLMQEGDGYDTFFASLIRFYAAEQEKLHFGEKTPQHAFFAETLCTWFPSCALIHIVRDPRDVVASLQSMPWASNRVVANARLWTTCTLAAERSHHRDNYLRVNYEHLVGEPEDTLRSICTFLGEPYDPSMLESQEHVQADKWWFQRAQEPLHQSRVGRWRSRLDESQVALIERVSGSVMKQVGYETTCQVPTFRTLAYAVTKECVGVVHHKVADLPRMWYHWVRPTHLKEEEAWIDRHV